ncbi:hypothetical protein Tco_0914907 [Tanacetum coccineum]
MDLDADDKTFIKVVSDEDSTDEAPILWSALAGWEVISTPLVEINALYRSDQSTKHFTTLREILHMVDRQCLLKLYSMVVKYYENHLVAGAGLMLWGDLQVLMDSQAGEVLYMFSDVSYPLSVKLMENMLNHKLEIDKDVVGNDMTTTEQLIRFIKNQIDVAQLEIDKDVVGNDMTTTEQLIRFIKNQIADAQCVSNGFHFLFRNKCFDKRILATDKLIFKYSSQDSSRLDVAAQFIFQSSRYVVPTGRVVVPTGRYVVPAGKVIIIVSPGRLSLVPTGRVLSPGRVK